MSTEATEFNYITGFTQARANAILSANFNNKYCETEIGLLTQLPQPEVPEIVDGEKVDIEPSTHKHIVVKYDRTFISPELANKMLGITIDNYDISFNSSGHALESYVNYSYPNPFYIPESDEL